MSFVICHRSGAVVNFPELFYVILSWFFVILLQGTSYTPLRMYSEAVIKSTKLRLHLPCKYVTDIALYPL